MHDYAHICTQLHAGREDFFKSPQRHGKSHRRYRESFGDKCFSRHHLAFGKDLSANQLSISSENAGMHVWYLAHASTHLRPTVFLFDTFHFGEKQKPTKQ